MATEENKALLNHRKFAEIIKASGLTQEEFAEEVGISDRYVRCLKTKNKDISVSLAYSISQKSGCSIESMLTVKSIETHNAEEMLRYYRQQLAKTMELTHAVKNNLQNISGLLSILSLQCERYNIALKNITTIRLEVNETIARLNEYVQKTPNKINICRCSLNQLICETLQHQLAQLKAHQINLQTRLAENLPLIFLDRQRIRQVLLACLNNSQAAILAKGKPGGQIIISTQLIESENMVQILLEDNGVGLTTEQRANFFNPYYTTKINGSGIGTTISQSIIKMHGGRVSISGKPQEGCCVKIELPIINTPVFNYDDLYTEIADMLF